VYSTVGMTALRTDLHPDECLTALRSSVTRSRCYGEPEVFTVTGWVGTKGFHIFSSQPGYGTRVHAVGSVQWDPTGTRIAVQMGFPLVVRVATLLCAPIIALAIIGAVIACVRAAQSVPPYIGLGVSLLLAAAWGGTVRWQRLQERREGQALVQFLLNLLVAQEIEPKAKAPHV
jgi:hypothetical protein